MGNGVFATSGVVRGGFGGFNGPHSHQSRFFHSRKVAVVKYYSLSLTTRRTINSHDLRKTNHLGGVYCLPIDTILWYGALVLSLVESLHTNVLPYILCIVVHFQPVKKLLQKGVRVHHRCDFDAKKMQNYSPLPRSLPQWEKTAKNHKRCTLLSRTLTFRQCDGRPR